MKGRSDRLSQDDFQFIIDKTPLVSIDLIIINSKGQVLLGLRNEKPAQGYWFVPGGRILKNETIDEAFRRITHEEIGVEMDINDSNLIGVYDHIYTDNKFGTKDINTHYVSIGIKIATSRDFMINPDDQHKEIRWLSIDQLMNDESVHENTKFFFKKNNEITREEAVTFWRDQSNQMWSRTQTAAVIEAGGLTGWYTLYREYLSGSVPFYFYTSLVILGFSGLMLLILSLLMKRDAQYMDICGEIAGNKIPRPKSRPFLGLRGRTIAVLIPLSLGIANICFVILLLLNYLLSLS